MSERKTPSGERSAPPGERKALWGGRFEGATAESLRALGDSLHFDRLLVECDLTASVAHARMLGEQGIIPQDDADKIVDGLTDMLGELTEGTLEVDGDDEDVHSWIERVLTERIGDAGARLHTARSRNDQVATAFRLWVRGACEALTDFTLPGLVAALVEQAQNTSRMIVPAYTHLQRGQPVVLAHHLLAYAEMLDRDVSRFFACMDSTFECPLGSGAATGVPYPVDRLAVAEELDFDSVTANSMDAVSDRDFAVEFLAACALCGVHLSRLAEDVCLWASSEWGLLKLGDSVSTGSSIMPQKRNPDGAELVRGKTGRLIGALTGLLTTLKGLPMTYNRDLQEDKEAVFDAYSTLTACTKMMEDTLARSTFRPDAAARLLRRGHLLATELADFLVRRGVAFRHAHEAVGALVKVCEEKGVDLSDLDEAAVAEIDGRFKGCAEALDFEAAVNRRDHVGGTAFGRVDEAVDEWISRFESEEDDEDLVEDDRED